MKNSQKIGAAAILSVLSLLLACILCEGSADDPQFRAPATTDVNIFTPDGKQKIGRGRYTVSFANDTETVSGESKYFEGERDLELESMRSDGRVLTLVRYQHTFFNSDQSLQRALTLDAGNGSVECNIYLNGTLIERHASTMDIPADTYAGAAQILFIESHLRRGERIIQFHSFTCTPTPAIFAAEALVKEDQARLPSYSGNLAKLDIQPDLGWLDLVVAPFTPKMSAWFDPLHSWRFTGGLFDRYYEGPRVLILRASPDT